MTLILAKIFHDNYIVRFCPPKAIINNVSISHIRLDSPKKSDQWTNSKLLKLQGVPKKLLRLISQQPRNGFTSHFFPFETWYPQVYFENNTIFEQFQGIDIFTKINFWDWWFWLTQIILFEIFMCFEKL